MWEAEIVTMLASMPGLRPVTVFEEMLRRHSELDLNEMVGNFDDILRQMAGVGVELKLELSPDPLLVALDSGQMEMALLQSCPKRRGRYAGGRQLGDPRHEESNWPAVAIVEIVDHGTGMQPEVVCRAAEPLFTTKPKGSGTGLGLLMVNGFAAQCGGSVEITSAPGEGTTIALRFPFLNPVATS